MSLYTVDSEGCAWSRREEEAAKELDGAAAPGAAICFLSGCCEALVLGCPMAEVAGRQHKDVVITDALFTRLLPRQDHTGC